MLNSLENLVLEKPELISSCKGDQALSALLLALLLPSLPRGDECYSFRITVGGGETSLLRKTT